MPVSPGRKPCSHDAAGPVPSYPRASRGPPHAADCRCLEQAGDDASRRRRSGFPTSPRSSPLDTWILLWYKFRGRRLTSARHNTWRSGHRRRTSSTAICCGRAEPSRVRQLAVGSSAAASGRRWRQVIPGEVHPVDVFAPVSLGTPPKLPFCAIWSFTPGRLGHVLNLSSPRIGPGMKQRWCGTSPTAHGNMPRRSISPRSNGSTGSRKGLCSPQSAMCLRSSASTSTIAAGRIPSSGSDSPRRVSGSSTTIVRMVSGEAPLVVFVSSRISDQTLWARNATFDVLQQPDWIVPWLFEHTPASSESLPDCYLGKVRSSDLVIWLVDETTTPPVRNEIVAALETSKRILMFRISPPPSDSATELLVTHVGTKWDYVADSIDLKVKLRMALGDAIVSNWRAAGRTTTPPMLDVLHDRSRSRCVDRWLATGLPQELAITLADDPSVGALDIPVLHSRRFAIIRAEIGAGKSLAAERLFQDALARARNSKQERTPVFLEARHIIGPLEQTITKEVGAAAIPDSDSLLVIIDGLDEVPPDRRARLARAARHLTAEWGSARAIVTRAC